MLSSYSLNVSWSNVCASLCKSFHTNKLLYFSLLSYVEPLVCALWVVAHNNAGSCYFQGHFYLIWQVLFPMIMCSNKFLQGLNNTCLARAPKTLHIYPAFIIPLKVNFQNSSKKLPCSCLQTQLMISGILHNRIRAITCSLHTLDWKLTMR